MPVDQYQAQVTLLVKLPGELSTEAIPLTISEQIAECMRPLPRNREVPWDVRAQQEAQRMMEARQQAASHIAEHITASLLKAFQARDPINGYTSQSEIPNRKS